MATGTVKPPEGYTLDSPNIAPPEGFTLDTLEDSNVPRGTLSDKITGGINLATKMLPGVAGELLRGQQTQELAASMDQSNVPLPPSLEYDPNKKFMVGVGAGVKPAESVTTASALPEKAPSYRTRIMNVAREAMGMEKLDTTGMSRADILKNKARAEVEKFVQENGGEGLVRSQIPEQFVSSMYNTATFGLAEPQARPPMTTSEEIASGLGSLAGLIIGPSKAANKIKIPYLEKALGTKQGGRLSVEFGKAVARESLHLSKTLGLAGAGQALDQNNLMDALNVLKDQAEEGAKIGAVFGVAGRVMPKSQVIGWAARFGLASATLDLMSGNRPWDDRELAQKVYDYGLNAFFTFRGQPLRQGELAVPIDFAKSRFSRVDIPVKPPEGFILDKTPSETVSAPEAAQVPFAEAETVIPEDRRVAPRETFERRQDLAQRKRVEEMTPAEMKKEILTNPKSGLPSARAYDESPRDANQAFMDVDDFKEVNTKLTYEGADQVLGAIGKVMDEEAAKAGIKPFHLHGDEFISESNDKAALEAYSKNVQDRLANAIFNIELADGTKIQKKGLGVSYGIAESKSAAEESLKASKQARAEAGLRTGSAAARGKPVPVSQEAAKGVQDHQRRTTESLKQKSESAPVQEPEITNLDAEIASTSQTETKAFKDWFGDSKVVDENGKPLVVYHGTAEDIKYFDPSKRGASTKAKSAEKGFFFTSSTIEAEQYSELAGNNKVLGKILEDIKKAEEERNWDRYENLVRKAEEIDQNIFRGQNIVPVYLSIKNPKIVDFKGESYFGIFEDMNRAIDEAIAQGYDGLFIKNIVDSPYGATGPTDHYLAFKPEQIKSAIGNRGTFSKDNPNILYANPLNVIYDAWRKTADKALKWADDSFFYRLSPLGKLPKQKEFLRQRYRLLGKIASIDEVAKKINDTFSKSGEDQNNVYNFLTTKDADPYMIKDVSVRRRAVSTKRLIDRIGKELVNKGLLSKASYEKYKGSYLPRLYLKHLLDENTWKALGAGKKVSDLGYLKERKDIPEDVRRIILGEITDPGYLASKGAARSMRDIAILDFLDEIAKTEDWIFKDSVVDWNGKKVSASWLQEEANRLESQSAYYDEGTRQKALNIVKQMRAIADPAIEKTGKVPKDYRQVPDTTRYGRLRGMFVRKEIYDDLIGTGQAVSTDASPAEWLLGYGGAGTKITQFWKMSKVALNPPTQIRNFVSNGIMLHWSGVPFHMVPTRVIQAIKEMSRNGPHWRVAKKWGVTGSTFSANEIYRIEQDLLDLEAKQKGNFTFAQLKQIAGKVANKAGDIYQVSEGIFKTAKIIDAMEREGMNESDAVMEAQKWLYDYSLVPPSVRYLRNAPVGVPFMTFYYKTAPRFLEVATQHPERFIPYVAIPYLLSMFIADEYDVEKKDIDALKKALPQWLQDRGNAHFMPYKDKYGRWQALDIGYFFPWAMFTEAAKDAQKGDIGGVIGTTGLLGGPIPDLIAAIKTNIDPFTGKEIINENDPEAKQVSDLMNYLWRMSAPTFMTDIGFAGHMARALNKTVDKYGDPKSTEFQAALRLFGVNLYPIEPTKSRRENISRMNWEMKEIGKRMKSRMRDKNLTPDDRKEIRRQYKELIKAQRERIKKYSEESKIHPNLK